MRCINSSFFVIILILQFYACKNNNPGAQIAPTQEKSIIMEDLNPNELIAAVRIGEKWTFIDIQGNKVIDRSFAFADNFSQGYACVSEGGIRSDKPEGVLAGEFFFINIDGEELPHRSITPSYFSDGVAVLESSRNNYAIMNTDGDIVAKNFETMLPFSNGLSPAKKGDKLGYINTDGEWEFLMKSGDIIDVFRGGIARVKRNGKTGFINPAGQWLIEPELDMAYRFSEGMAAIEIDEKFGFINDEGDIIIPADYNDCGDYSEGLVAVKKNGKWGYIDKEGEVVIPFSFTDCRGFSEGMAAIMQNGKIGYIDTNGKIKIPPSMEAAYDMQNGYTVFLENGKIGYIDQSGNRILEAQYDRANYFVNPEAENPLVRIN